jgi:hypothetical protein
MVAVAKLATTVVAVFTVIVELAVGITTDPGLLLPVKLAVCRSNVTVVAPATIPLALLLDTVAFKTGFLAEVGDVGSPTLVAGSVMATGGHTVEKVLLSSPVTGAITVPL